MKNLITTLVLACLFSAKSFGSIIIQNGLTHIHDLSAHSQTDGKVVLKNIGTKTEGIKIYFTDLTTGCQSQINYPAPGTNIRSLYPFVNVSTTNYVIQPGEEYELTYQIDLNKNQFESGSLWVLMMIEVVDPISKEAVTSGFEIGSKIRYAVQLVTNIGQKNGENLSFSNVKLNKNLDGEKLLDAAIENGGNFMVVPNVSIQIFDASGNKVKDIAVPAKKVYPQNCHNFSLPLEGLPKGKYQAVLLADYLEESIGVNLDIEI